MTSIAIRRLDTGETESFSIHAEEHASLDQIDSKYDVLEKKMLERFYSYIEHAGELDYLHWNMRDVT